MQVLQTVVVLFGIACFAAAEECGQCDLASCPEPVNCVAGTVFTDECKCCRECGLAEGELCDLPSEERSYGTCGDNLYCKERTDAPGEAMCFCNFTEALCGSDGVTYRNLCHLRESIVLNNKPDLHVAVKGPCKSEPKIVSEPEHQRNHTGGSVAISCEAEGYPIPSIDWIFTRANGKVLRLPEDDTEVSLNTRGGPEKYQITGWIQIMKLQERHEGDYTCVATNKHGVAKAVARLIVLNEHNDL